MRLSALALVLALCALLAVSVTAKGTECAVCEFLVGEVENVITGPATEAQVKNVLDKACAVLPARLSGVCEALVDSYTSVLINAVISKASPATVCAKLSVCAASAAPVVAAPAPIAAPALHSVGGIECTLCTFVVQEAYALIGTNTTEANIASVLGKVCNVLPTSLQGVCSGVIDEYTPTLIDLLQQKFPASEICQKISMCPSSRLAAQAETSKVGSLACPLCTLVIGEAEKMIGTDTSEANIAKVLDKVCNVLPSALQGTCAALIDQYTPTLIEMLAQKFPANVICQKIGLCASSKVAVEKVGSLACPLCTLVIGEAEKMIGTDTSEANIAKVLEKVCNVLPTALQGTCAALIEQYTPTLIEMLGQKFPANVICQKIGLCASSAPKMLAAQRKIAVEKVGSLQCTLCSLVIGQAEKLIGTDTSEANIAKVLDKVCNVLPSALQGACAAMIDQYTPTLIELLAQKFPASVICQKIGLCPSSKSLEVPHGTVTCPLCSLVIGQAEKLIASDRSEAAIAAALGKSCSVLPSALRGACTALITQYTPALVEMLEAKLPANVICQKIGLCSSSLAVAAPAATENKILCPLCEYVVKHVELFIEGNRTETKIREGLDVVCKFLPLGLDATCRNFVDEYTEMLVVTLLKYETPERVCYQIKLCPNPDEVVAVAVEAPAALKDFKCAACEYVASLLDQFLANNRTETEIVHFVERVCSFLPGALRAECDALIETYGPVVIDFAINKEDPQTLCTQIRQCKRTASTPAAIVPPVAKVEQTTTTVSNVGSLPCAACEYLMSVIEGQLTSNSTEAQIVSVVENACKVLPSVLQGFCNSIIEGYGARLIEFLVNKENPAVFCAQVGLCPRTAATPAAAVLRPATVRLPTVRITAAPVENVQGLSCAACEYLVSVIESQITNNSTEAEIIKIVDNACKVLPSALESLCYSIMDSYGPKLIEYLVAKQPPAQFCGSIGLCAKSPRAASNVVPSRAAVAAVDSLGDLKCPVCEYVIAYIEQLVSSQSTEAEIVAIVEKVCTFLPGSLTGMCDSMIEAYGPQLINYLINREPPAKFCAQVGLCKA